MSDLVKIEGIMNAEKYRQILINHSIASAKRVIGIGYIFQQDNHPNHMAQKVKSYLERKKQSENVQVMKWSPRNPHMNIIESLWE